MDYPRSTPLVKYRQYANSPTISAGSATVKIITRSIACGKVSSTGRSGGIQCLLGETLRNKVQLQVHLRLPKNR